MSMNGNQHYTNATDTWRSEEQRAIQATLALAHEQRTANLIAFERSQWQAWKDGSLNDGGVHLWHVAAGQITERLGLE